MAQLLGKASDTSINPQGLVRQPLPSTSAASNETERILFMTDLNRAMRLDVASQEAGQGFVRPTPS